MSVVGIHLDQVRFGVLLIQNFVIDTTELTFLFYYVNETVVSMAIINLFNCCCCIWWMDV